MILYLASMENKLHAEMNMSHGTKNALTTYWSLKNKPDHLKSFSETYNFNEYFLDSGAFGAWMRNETLDVKQYGEFLKKNEKYITHYANLDDKLSENTTKNNLAYLQSLGLKPLPVWHFNTKNFALLKELLDNNDYIAIGGLAKEKEGSKEDYMRIFKMAFSYGKTEDGKLRKKYHGFGITKVEVLMAYPWYSVDSTTWVTGARFGTFHVFDGKKIQLISGKDKNKIIKFWNYIPSDLRDLNKIIDHNGILNYHNRQRISANCFKEIEKHCTKAWENKGLFY